MNTPHLIFAWLLALIVPMVTASEIPSQSFYTLSSTGKFYSQGFGAVAFLPTLGDERYIQKVSTHCLMKNPGAYKINKPGDNCFFRINHLSGESETSYLGVTVYLFYPEKRNGEELRLSRNESTWLGSGQRKLGPLRKGPRESHVSLSDYIEAHTTSDLFEADKLLSFTWHAAVSTGAPNSWDYRNKWAQVAPPKLSDFLRKLNLHAPSYSTELNAQIIQFTTRTGKLWSGKPVFFGFNKSGAAGAYLRIFSPSLIDKEYYLIFD